MSLFQDLLNLEQAVVDPNRNVKTIWAALKVVGDDIIGGSPLTMEGEDVAPVIERIRAACAPRAGEDALLDGKILQAVMQILPIILSLFGL